jgi:EAL domain-containing protein (putative c-di-GMP-specific phosphodiesterase class I)/PAS domain-containing protein
MGKRDLATVRRRSADAEALVAASPRRRQRSRANPSTFPPAAASETADPTRASNGLATVHGSNGAALASGCNGASVGSNGAGAAHRSNGAGAARGPDATRGVEGDASIAVAVLAALEEGLLVIDRNGGLLRANPAASAILGMDFESLPEGTAWWEPLAVCLAADGGQVDIGSQVMQSGLEVRGVQLQIDRHGTPVLLSVNYLPLRGADGAIEGLVLSFRDVSDHELERTTLLQTQDRLREAHDVARLASWEWSPATGEVLVSQALAASDMSPGTIVTLEEWISMLAPEQHWEIHEDFDAFVHGGREESTRRLRHVLAGGPIWLEVRSRAVRDSEGRLACVRGTAQDVTEQQLAQQQLTRTRDFLQATLDSLTTHVAVLDGRGEIVMTNHAWSSFGLANGAIPASAGVGANYLAACDSAAGDPAADAMAAGLRAIIGGAETEFSIEYPCDAPGEPRWFQCRATRYEGGGPVQVVIAHENISERKAEELKVEVDLEKLAWVARIEEALTHDRFVLHAQPILELSSGRIVQRELLLRMRPPGDPIAASLISPGEFLATAEEFGLIAEIDRWVIDRSVELAARGLPVELNVSGRSVSEPRLVDYIRLALERTGADPQLIVFEITETTLVDNDAAARAFVGRLHALGCRIALDDFGTGYSGFMYLKQLPIDFLKIDVEFVRDLAYNPASRIVVEAIVRLAKGFDLETVAEGVEDQATLEELRGLGVDFAQGYHIGRPAPLPEDRSTHIEETR